jgi:hypothetical protein
MITMSRAYRSSPISAASAARDAQPEPPAEPLLHLAVDEPVGETVAKREAGWQRSALLPELADLSSDSERPVEQATLETSCPLELRQ